VPARPTRALQAAARSHACLPSAASQARHSPDDRLAVCVEDALVEAVHVEGGGGGGQVRHGGGGALRGHDALRRGRAREGVRHEGAPHRDGTRGVVQVRLEAVRGDEPSAQQVHELGVAEVSDGARGGGRLLHTEKARQGGTGRKREGGPTMVAGELSRHRRAGEKS